MKDIFSGNRRGIRHTEKINTPAPAAIPIDGTLDLHMYRPKDVKSLVSEYIAECMKRGIYQLRIIHGKGTGVLRGIVHSLLDKNKQVERYALGGTGAGGWGATVVTLKQGSHNPPGNR